MLVSKLESEGKFSVFLEIITQTYLNLNSSFKFQVTPIEDIQFLVLT